jgi:Zn-dependent alcohol dehydrogenase
MTELKKKSGNNYNGKTVVNLKKNDMLTKEKIRRTIDNFPHEILSLDEVIEKLILLDKVEQGLQDIKEGKVHTTEEVRKKLERWLK